MMRDMHCIGAVSFFYKTNGEQKAGLPPADVKFRIQMLRRSSPAIAVMSEVLGQPGARRFD